MDWLDLLAVQGTLKSLLQHHSSKASILQSSAFFIAQLSHPYMITGKTKALTIWTFVGKVMFLLYNILSRLVITFLPRRKRLLISWLQSPSWFIPNDAAREFAVFPTMYIFPMRVCYIRENLCPLLQKQSYGERLSDIILEESYKGSIQIP